MARNDYDPKMDTGIDGVKSTAKPAGCGWGCLGCLGIVAVVIVALVIFGALQGASGDSSADRPILAKIACEKAVRNSLKAPSTAEFSGTQATGSGDDWNVVGEVDAENSFSAKVRNTFACSVAFQGEIAVATVTRLG